MALKLYYTAGDATPGYITTTDPYSIWPGVPAGFACWLYLGAVTTGTPQDFFCMGASANTISWRVTTYSASGAPNLYVGQMSSGGTYYFAITSGTISTGTWYHVAGIWPANNARYAYLNGTQSTVESTDATPSGTMNRLNIGASYWGGGTGMYLGNGANWGLLADFAVWNLTDYGNDTATRTAAFARMVTSLSQGVSAGFYPAGRTLWLPFLQEKQDGTGVVPWGQKAGGGVSLTISARWDQVPSPHLLYPSPGVTV